METIKADFRAGYVALIGKPNAGKSTLMNALLNIKLSIISARPQTTRRRVLGILNTDDMQVVFMDTPGLLKPRYQLQKKMMEYVDLALHDADALILLIDVTDKAHPPNLEWQKLNPKNLPVILVLNKIDLLEKAQLLPLIETYHSFYNFDAIIPVSALKSDGLDDLKDSLIKLIPYSPPFYPPDVITDQPERFFVGELIREKIFRLFYQEVPYSTEVVIEEFKERGKGKDYISATIIVERRSQKGILIGKNGEALKKIGSSARREIEEFLGREVFLELRVKVQEDWRKNDSKLHRLGF